MGETAVVMHHVAYGYDFVHDGACLTAAMDWIFPEPGFDCAAFARDPRRRRVLNVACADGWAALSSTTTLPEPLHCWVVVELRDGTTSVEALLRADEWLDEPGGAEFVGHVVRIHAMEGSAVRLAA